MAVGFSRPAERDFHVELRPQRADHVAFRIAKEYAEKHEREVHVLVVPRVEIPPRAQVERVGQTVGDDRPPLEIGISVGHNDGTAGTLGAFVTIKDTDYILSCNHVLALFNRATRHDHIYHPGKPDRSPLSSDDRIARLTKWNELASGDENQFDAAIAELNEGIDYAGNVIPADCIGAGKRIKAHPDILNMKPAADVIKIGRTTRQTGERVSAFGFDNLTIKGGSANYLFSDVIEVISRADRPFSLPGDSGSLVFTADGFEAIGLVFAGGTIVNPKTSEESSVSYVCRLDHVLAFFRATLTD
jgi:hypothetical protein